MESWLWDVECGMEEEHGKESPLSNDTNNPTNDREKRANIIIALAEHLSKFIIYFHIHYILSFEVHTVTTSSKQTQ